VSVRLLDIRNMKPVESQTAGMISIVAALLVPS
jgi:hypothetical protein